MLHLVRSYDHAKTHLGVFWRVVMFGLGLCFGGSRAHRRRSPSPKRLDSFFLLKVNFQYSDTCRETRLLTFLCPKLFRDLTSSHVVLFTFSRSALLIYLHINFPKSHRIAHPCRHPHSGNSESATALFLKSKSASSV